MIEILKAEPAQITQVLVIERAAFDPPWSESSLMSEASRNDAYFGVAVESGVVLGFCVLRLISGEAELFQIAVDEARRQLGLGSRLLQEALRFAENNGALAVYLEVRAGNAPAIGLYKRHGFVTSGRRKNYYSNPVDDAVIMVLELKRPETYQGDL